jgi:predicted RNase H-like nuclease (RuvC/YqgF family)
MLICLIALPVAGCADKEEISAEQNQITAMGARLDNLQTAVNDWKTQSEELKKESKAAREALEEYKKTQQTSNDALVKQVGNQIDLMTKAQASINESLSSLQQKQAANIADINNLKTAMDNQIKLTEQLKIQISGLSSTATTTTGGTTPSTVSDDVITVQATKYTDSVSGMEEGVPINLDFTIKMTNKLDKEIDRIIIQYNITCSRIFDSDDITVKDSKNSHLIFDYGDWDGDIVECTFQRSTGSSTVYLDPKQIFTFNPRLTIIPIDYSDRTYKFTLTINSVTYEVQ